MSGAIFGTKSDGTEKRVLVDEDGKLQVETVGGSSDTELPAAAVPGDADANGAVPAVASRIQGWDPVGSAWTRLQSLTSNPGAGAAGLIVRVVGGALDTTVSAGNALLTAIRDRLPDALGTGGGVKTSLVDLGGGATAAKQDTGNTSLGSIDTKTPVLGQAAMVGSSPVVIASDQSAVAVADGGGSLTVDAVSLPLPTGASTAANQTTGNASLASIDGKLPAQGQAAMAASIPVVIANNQSAVPISDGGGSLTVDAASWPLPTGAATAANQTTANASLSSIDTKTPALGQAAMAASTPVVIASNQTDVPISAASLPLPTGAATAANQTTGNNSLASIDTKLPAQGQAAMAASVPVVIANNQSAVPISDGGGSITVDITGAIPAGTNNIGDVDVLTLPALSAGSNVIGAIELIGSAVAPLTAIKATVEALGDGTGRQGINVIECKRPLYELDTEQVAAVMQRAVSTQTGAMSLYSTPSAGVGTTGVSVKGSGGRVYCAIVSNKHATDAFWFFIDNKATAPVNTDVPEFRVRVAAQTTVIVVIEMGLPFATGIGVAASTDASPGQLTLLGSDNMHLTLGYA